jgi:hypothetical protein
MWPGERGRVRLWAGPLLLAGAALAFDALNRTVPFGLLSTGPLDEVAHLATAALGLLVLACFVDAPRRFYVAALAASVAIDLDHIPLYLGLLGDDGQRPVTHSLATVVVVTVAAAVSRRHRAVLAGVATGLVLHFARARQPVPAATSGPSQRWGGPRPREAHRARAGPLRITGPSSEPDQGMNDTPSSEVKHWALEKVPPSASTVTTPLCWMNSRPLVALHRSTGT